MRFCGNTRPRKAISKRENFRFRRPKLSSGCMTSRFQNHSRSQFAVCGKRPNLSSLPFLAQIKGNNVHRRDLCNSRALYQCLFNQWFLQKSKKKKECQCINYFRGSGSPLESGWCQEGRNGRWKEMQGRKEWTSSSLDGSFSGPRNLCSVS